MNTKAIHIGTRRELFVDECLVQEMRSAWLRLHRPERREVAMTFDAPWEDSVAFPDRMLPWEGGWRLYYRAGILDLNREEDTTVVALADTRDGVVFTRPELGLAEVKGTRRNNVLQVGGFPVQNATRSAGLPSRMLRTRWRDVMGLAPLGSLSRRVAYKWLVLPG